MRNIYAPLQYKEVKDLIIKHCSFSLGAQIIEELRPSNNKLAVKLANERLKEALGMVISYGPMPFGGIYDVTNEVELAKRNATLQPFELVRIAQQAAGIEAIFRYIKGCNTEKDHIADLVSSLTSFSSTANEINKCINYAGEIYDNASSELAAIRRKIKTLEKNIANKMQEYVSKNSSYLQDNIIAERNGRSVILVKNSYKNTIEGLQYGSSASGGATYVEPSLFISMNNDLQSAINDEKQEIQRILYRLSQLVKKDGDGYLANVETLGLLDSFFARAAYGKEVNGTVGQMGTTDFIIKNARHPLIDSRKVVANSYHIISPVKTILITGPNTGGKTVSLKIFGLFALMYLSGMPLPCDEAIVPLFDHVYYDIGDGQSIEDDLSTFSSHISNIAYICKHATEKSLVIMDELGSATDPVEGQALASAVLDYFRSKNIYVVATTHFSKLKAYAKQYNDIMVASVEFDQKNLKPTYRYIENSIGSSNAIEIAKRYGIADSIINSAYQFKSQQQSVDDLMIEKLQAQLELAQQQNEKLKEMEKQLADQIDQLNKDKEKLVADKEEIINKAKEEAFEIVIEAQAKSEELIEELKKQKSYNINEVAKIKHSFKNIVEEADTENDLPDEEIKVGDYVRISVTNQKGEIISMDKKNAVVLCDGLKIKASLPSLVKTVKPVVKQVKTKTRIVKNSNFSIELNLIGMRVEEAMLELDKYLDSAVLANVPFVRIVHGMGTGALRKAVWEKLKKFKLAKRYEFGGPSEGGSGATIVYFRDIN